MRRCYTSTAYLACLAVMVGVGFFYQELSPGLAMPGGDGPFYCKDLLSAGREDDAMLALFTFAGLPLGLRLLRIQRPVVMAEVFVLALALALAGFGLWLASLDCASIFYTAFMVPDLWLAAALLAMPLSLISLISIWREG